MTYLLARTINGEEMYLSEMYKWGKLPNVFPEWQLPAVLDLAMRFPDRPQRVGELVDGTLENAIWKELE